MDIYIISNTEVCKCPQKDIYDSYLGLGTISFSKANFKEALTYFDKCSEPVVKTNNSRAYWQGRIGIGQVKLTMGDYQGARHDLSSVLNEVASSPDDIDTYSMAYGSMIECMSTIGQYYEAIDSCDAAIRMITKYSSPKNTYIANILTYQGEAFISVGRIKEGEQCMNKAMDIYQNILGESHPNYADACVRFANYYILVGELNKAREMSDKALELFNQKFGRNHLASVAAHMSKCNLYQTFAEYDKAQAELDTISAIYKGSELYNDFTQIQIRSCEAAIKMSQGESDKGIEIFQQAIKSINQTLGKNAVQLIGMYNQIVRLR